MKTLIFNVSFLLLLLMTSCNNQDTRSPAVGSTSADYTTTSLTGSTTMTSIKNDSMSVNEKEENEESEKKDD